MSTIETHRDAGLPPVGTAGTDQESVAAYATVEGAALAATRLVELGFDEQRVGITPRDYREVDCDPVMRRMADGARTGALASFAIAVISIVAALVGVDRLVGTVIPVVAAATLFGSLIGTLGAAAVAWRRRSEGIIGQADELAPARFEVVVARRAGEARHLLAGWWDSNARPVPSRTPSR